jgi:hypothetical protein
LGQGRRQRQREGARQTCDNQSTAIHHDGQLSPAALKGWSIVAG